MNPVTIPVDALNAGIRAIHASHLEATGEDRDVDTASMSLEWKSRTPVLVLTFSDGLRWCVRFGPVGEAILQRFRMQSAEFNDTPSLELH